MRLDPYLGAQLAPAESYRNVAATGARPIAVTDCLNFGSPEDAAVIGVCTIPLDELRTAHTTTLPAAFG